MSHRHEHYAARPHPEFVVLDVGGLVGGLIIHTDAHMHGVEVEISPAGRDTERSHKEVLERSAAGRPAYTAVFDGLVQGNYTLWTNGVARAREVPVTGGEIAELDWTNNNEEKGDLHAEHRTPRGGDRRDHRPGHLRPQAPARAR